MSQPYELHSLRPPCLWIQPMEYSVPTNRDIYEVKATTAGSPPECKTKKTLVEILPDSKGNSQPTPAPIVMELETLGSQAQIL